MSMHPFDTKAPAGLVEIDEIAGMEREIRDQTEDCPNCQNAGFVHTRSQPMVGYVFLYWTECDACKLKGPVTGNIVSARYWWNLLARLKRDFDRRYLPVRNERPHNLDGAGSDPFIEKTATAESESSGGAGPGGGSIDG